MKTIRLNWVLLLVFLISCSTNDRSERHPNSGPVIPPEAVQVLNSPKDLDSLLMAIGDKQVVLLGEATHGTSEFYTWRAEISKRLIQEKGFNIIAVEADWADAYQVNNYIRGISRYNTAVEALKAFDRWPEWMWANEEIAELTEWLKNYNQEKDPSSRVGFYGVDVYGIWESLEIVHKYLKATNPGAEEVALQAIQCFAPFNNNEFEYARSTLNSEENCADELSRLYASLKNSIPEAQQETEGALDVLQNMLVTMNAERYYRTAVVSNAASWNIRDQYMAVTVDNLLKRFSPDAKIIIWAHNTHVGDARATPMADAGMVNLGQILREQYGEEDVYILGFGTFKGRVIAASEWGLTYSSMRVPVAIRNSWEWILHQHSSENKIIYLDKLSNHPFFSTRIGHRAIGVEYDPGQEIGNYVPSVLPQRYDAFIFIDESTALHPIYN